MFWATAIAPRVIPRLFLHNASMKFTMGFSNTPGPLKPWYISDDKGNISHGRWCKPYVTISGRVGLCVSCMSYAGSFYITVTADDGICRDTRFLCN